MKPRYYQKAAFDAAISWIKKSVEPGLLDLATGAGKSLIIAMIAEWLQVNTSKKTLVLAPSKELVEQDYKKYMTTGYPASIFSASVGKKCLRQNVVFGTPQTVKNNLYRFGNNFACVIIDEADAITPTIKAIIEHLRSNNKLLRVIGLTATPYRLGTGYIYKYDLKDKLVQDAIEPFYFKLLYRLDAHELIKQGYLTPPIADLEHVDSYDTSNIKRFTAKEMEQTFEGKGRLTYQIVLDIVKKCAYRNGVLIFASTIKHAEEILESLPKNNSAIVHGGTKNRDEILSNFHNRRVKYLVNVNVLTVGFDAPHVDCVAILRATESARLMQQIIGRGLRLIDQNTAGDLFAISESQKPNCLVLDYAGNIERHCPDGDLFNPEITTQVKKEGSVPMKAKCPSCSHENEFNARPNHDGFNVDENGYFVDLTGERLEMPGHYGRRCEGFNFIKGSAVRCEYRWTLKECPECDHENDIAARYCEKCKAEIIDPNEKLKLDYAKFKKDPYTATVDKVLNWRYQEWSSKRGNVTLRVDYVTECRTFTMWYMPQKQVEWLMFCRACGVEASTVEEFIKQAPKMPFTISAYKNKASGFYEVENYNDE